MVILVSVHGARDEDDKQGDACDESKSERDG